MTTPATNPNPSLEEAITGYDPTGHQTNIAFQVGTVTQDATTGIYYAPLQISGAGVTGNLTNNNAAPGATNIGALVGIANAAAPTYTEGDQVLHSLNLSGSTRVNITNANANSQTTMANSAPVVIASDQSAVKTKMDFLEVAGVAAGSVTSTSTDLFASADMSAYSYFVLQLTGTWTMTLQAQWSNDNSNFVAGEICGIATTPAGSTSANGVYVIPKYGRYLRIRPSAWTSNASCVGTLECYTAFSPPTFGILAQQNGAWNMNSTADTTAIASAAYTTTQTQADQTNNSARGIKVFLSTTVASAGSVTLEIDGKDAASGVYYPILTGAAVTTVTTNVYTVYPGLTASANVAANDVLPHTYRIKVTANNANTQTYSVGYSTLV